MKHHLLNEYPQFEQQFKKVNLVILLENIYNIEQ